MVKLSANLGFLWKELALIDAIYAAKKAGFQAVECHWPYQTPPSELYQALEDTNLPMLGLNTSRGNSSAGDNGLAAIPGREQEARDSIDQAVDYAAAIGCRNVHVMAGKTDAGNAAESTFQQNLTYACQRAAAVGINILIEPLNVFDAPHYHLTTIDDARRTIDAIALPNIKIMFDCYHVQIMQGDLLRRFESNLAYIGHIQIASVPDRAEPDRGEVNYPWLLPELYNRGWHDFIGAEYKPVSQTERSLSWMSDYTEGNDA